MPRMSWVDWTARGYELDEIVRRTGVRWSIHGDESLRATVEMASEVTPGGDINRCSRVSCTNRDERPGLLVPDPSIDKEQKLPAAQIATVDEHVGNGDRCQHPV